MGFGFALRLLVLVLLLTCGAWAMADLRGGGGDDSVGFGRRWRQWSDAYYTVDDDHTDNPEMWMWRARKFGYYVGFGQTFLRKAFFIREV